MLVVAAQAFQNCHRSAGRSRGRSRNRFRGGRGSRGRSALDVEVRQPAEPARQVPVAVAEEGHPGWDEDRADDRGVQEDRHRQAEAHLLQGDQAPGGEPAVLLLPPVESWGADAVAALQPGAVAPRLVLLQRAVALLLRELAPPYDVLLGLIGTPNRRPDKRGQVTPAESDKDGGRTLKRRAPIDGDKSFAQEQDHATRQAT